MMQGRGDRIENSIPPFSPRVAPPYPFPLLAEQQATTTTATAAAVAKLPPLDPSILNTGVQTPLLEVSTVAQPNGTGREGRIEGDEDGEGEKGRSESSLPKRRSQRLRSKSRSITPAPSPSRSLTPFHYNLRRR